MPVSRRKEGLREQFPVPDSATDADGHVFPRFVLISGESLSLQSSKLFDTGAGLLSAFVLPFSSLFGPALPLGLVSLSAQAVPSDALSGSSSSAGLGSASSSATIDALSLSARFEQMIRSDAAIQLVAGGAAGAASRTAVSPFERTKILFQIQSSMPMGYHHKGTWDTLKWIYQNEGLMGYFKGNGTNVVRMVPYSAVQVCGFMESSSVSN